MSTLGDRMGWQGGDPPVELDVADVLTLLGVAGYHEDDQRRAVAAAVQTGQLGAHSLHALRRAGWIDEGAVDPGGHFDRDALALLDRYDTELDVTVKHLEHQAGRRLWFAAATRTLIVAGAAACTVAVSGPVEETVAVSVFVSALLGWLGSEVVWRRAVDLQVDVQRYVHVRAEIAAARRAASGTASDETVRVLVDQVGSDLERIAADAAARAAGPEPRSTDKTRRKSH